MLFRMVGDFMPLRLKELRKQAGLNQSELADKLGISTSAIGMYEQGRRDPDTQILIKIANIFNVSLDYLVGKSNEPEEFDIEVMTKNIAQSLIDQPALMFSADCYTEQELSELKDIIEQTVRNTLEKKLKK